MNNVLGFRSLPPGPPMNPDIQTNCFRLLYGMKSMSISVVIARLCLAFLPFRSPLRL